MFEHVPQQPVPAPQPLPVASQPGRPKPLSQPMAPQIPMADHAAMELFKRTGLSGVQKLMIVLIAVGVVAALIGVGVWLFMELDPFSSNHLGTPTNNANTYNLNGEVPLQALDTDKDGIRDIDEKRYGTSATLSDTDADGLSDYAELNQYHTSPILADTDGDTYNDKVELDNGYDPNGPGRLAE